MSAKNSVRNLSREDWLEKALNVVSREGGAKLRINNLVTEVGVTKGSFYWHFKDRDDFVRSLIDHWHKRYTLTVSDYLDDFDGSAREKLRKLMEMVFVEQLTRHDLAIRSWAIAEPKLQKLVKRTDDHRMNYLRMLFRGLKFDEAEADLRARVFLGYAAWEAALFETMTKSEREKKASTFFGLLVEGSDAG
jgi:AcrR family transcriptional regulator